MYTSGSAFRHTGRILRPQQGGGLSQGHPGEEMEQSQVQSPWDGGVLASHLLEGLRGRLAAVTEQAAGAVSVHAWDCGARDTPVSRWQVEIAPLHHTLLGGVPGDVPVRASLAAGGGDSDGCFHSSGRNGQLSPLFALLAGGAIPGLLISEGLQLLSPSHLG